MKKLSQKSIKLIIGLTLFLAALGLIIYLIMRARNKATNDTPTLPGGTTGSISGGATSATGLWSDNSFPLKVGSGDLGGGTRVANVQTYMNEGIEALNLGTKLTVDGKYGTNTKNIVNVFKKKNGLPEDGEISSYEYANYVLPGITSETTTGTVGGALSGITWN